MMAVHELGHVLAAWATGGKVTDSPANNIAIADAIALIDREVLTLRRNFQEMRERIDAGESIEVPRRAQFRSDSARAVEVAHQVVDRLFLAGGSRVLFKGNRINRHFQDIQAIRQHHANGTEKPAVNFGGLQFGKKNTDFFI